MLAFFRRVWSFARPYSTRLVLGQVCGILFALANGLLFLIIKLVIDPSLSTRLDLPFWETILAGVIAFYFGERS